MTSFVRKILQREENKGVELTVWRGKSKKEKKKRQKLCLHNPKERGQKETSGRIKSLSNPPKSEAPHAKLTCGAHNSRNTRAR